VADRSAVDADGSASLLPGLLFVYSLLFGGDGFQGSRHPWELSLVGVVFFAHRLGQQALDPVVMVGFLYDCVLDCGDDFCQQADLVVRGRSRLRVGVFFGGRGGLLGWRDVGQWWCFGNVGGGRSSLPGIGSQGRPAFPSANRRRPCVG